VHNNETEEWLKSGSEYLRKRVRRPVQTDDADARSSSVVWLDGAIRGWLPLDKSDYFKDPDTRLDPRALWRCVFDDVRAGEEDLEEEEVLQGVAAYEAEQKKKIAEAKKKPARCATSSTSRRSGGSRGSLLSNCPDGANGEEEGAGRGAVERKEWLTTGSSHLFKMIRRRLPKHCLLDPADHEWQHAQITGWLPAHKSNFFTGGGGQQMRGHDRNQQPCGILNFTIRGTGEKNWKNAMLLRALRTTVSGACNLSITKNGMCLGVSI